MGLWRPLEGRSLSSSPVTLASTRDVKQEGMKSHAHFHPDEVYSAESIASNARIVDGMCVTASRAITSASRPHPLSWPFIRDLLLSNIIL